MIVKKRSNDVWELGARFAGVQVTVLPLATQLFWLANDEPVNVPFAGIVKVTLTGSEEAPLLLTRTVYGRDDPLFT